MEILYVTNTVFTHSAITSNRFG